MGILSGNAIRDRIQSANLVISPTPADDDYSADSVDVHPGDKVYEWGRVGQGAVLGLQLWNAEFNYTNIAKQHLIDVPPDNHNVIRLLPHTFYLADLKEYTKLPRDLAMHIQGKSSLARLGVLVHLTAPHAHAGWEGRLTLEMYNVGPFSIELKPDMVVAQLTFWTLDGPIDENPSSRGKFDDQRDARGSGCGLSPRDFPLRRGISLPGVPPQSRHLLHSAKSGQNSFPQYFSSSVEMRNCRTIVEMVGKTSGSAL